MSNPTQTCTTCGRSRDCMLHMRGFPPDGAKRWLKRTCPNGGAGCEIKYRAGFELRGPIVGQGEGGRTAREQVSDEGSTGCDFVSYSAG